jgi:hypothetical protein
VVVNIEEKTAKMLKEIISREYITKMGKLGKWLKW